MNTYQWIGLITISPLILLTLYELFVRRTFRWMSLLWLSLWSTAVAVLLWPERTADVAKFFGIGRGVDLILYLALLGASVGFFLVYFRFRKMETRLVQLTRHIAIRDYEEKGRTKEEIPG